MHTTADSIRAYILAKDGNRPHLLTAAFTGDATLRMVVRTDAIAFPAVSTGRDAIAETLVRRFNQAYENVYTLCIGAPPADNSAWFSCNWLVAMSAKDGGAVRVGCGRYDWEFTPDQHKASALAITIEAMEILPADSLEQVMQWMSGLPYPWCEVEKAMAAAPDLAGVAAVMRTVPTPDTRRPGT